MEPFTLNFILIPYIHTPSLLELPPLHEAHCTQPSRAACDPSTSPGTPCAHLALQQMWTVLSAPSHHLCRVRHRLLLAPLPEGPLAHPPAPLLLLSAQHPATRQEGTYQWQCKRLARRLIGVMPQTCGTAHAADARRERKAAVTTACQPRRRSVHAMHQQKIACSAHFPAANSTNWPSTCNIQLPELFQSKLEQPGRPNLCLHCCALDDATNACNQSWLRFGQGVVMAAEI